MKVQAWQPGAPLYAVVNSLGFVACSTDGNKHSHHVALWFDRDRARDHAVEMQALGGGEYTVVEVGLVEL